MLGMSLDVLGKDLRILGALATVTLTLMTDSLLATS